MQCMHAHVLRVSMFLLFPSLSLVFTSSGKGVEYDRRVAGKRIPQAERIKDQKT